MATATSGTATREPLTKDDVSARAGEQISYEDLYRRWEQNQWQADSIAQGLEEAVTVVSPPDSRTHGAAKG